MSNGFSIQQRYWATVTHTHYSLLYFRKLSSTYSNITKAVNIFTAIMTAGSIAAWVIEIKAPVWIWPSLLGLMEIVRIVFPFFHIDKDILNLQKFTYLVNQHYSALEDDWLFVANGSYTEIEINTKIADFNKKINEIEHDIYNGVEIPQHKRLLSVIEPENNRYFEQFFNRKE